MPLTTLNEPHFDLDELNEINERSQRVKAMLKRTSELWLEIAREVNDAKNCLRRDAYFAFLQRASISEAVADKMPRIAQSTFLYSQQAKDHLQKADGWTTLYEIAKLGASEVQELIRALDLNPNQEITRKFIGTFKVPGQRKSQIITVATVTLNESDLMRIDYDLFQTLRSKMEEAQRIFDRSIQAVQMTLNISEIDRLENLVLARDCLPFEPSEPSELICNEITSLNSENPNFTSSH